MQSNMLHICALLALTAASSAAGLRDLASHDHALPAVHQRALQQAASASAVPYVSQLQGVLTEIEGVPGRPVTYKNVESALYIAYANAGALVPNEPSVIRPLGTDSSMLLAWQNSTAAVIMAFPASGGNSTFNATEPGFAPTDVDSFLQGDFAGAYPAAASPQAGPFLPLAAGNGRAAPPLTSLVANISSNSEVRRVVCTGYGNGGALAQLCGIWAAVTYPAAHIRTIAYGAPVVGNVEFAFSFQQLVDLSYLWSLSSDLDTTNTTTASGPADNVRLLNNATVVGNGSVVANSFGAYVEAIVEYYQTTSGSASLSNTTSTGDNSDSGGIRGFFNDIVNIGSTIVSAANNLGDVLDAISSVAYGGDENEALDEQQVQEALAAKNASQGCPPLLCKIRPAADYSCQVYNNGSNTIAPGSVTIGPVNDTGTQLAVAWNESSSTATIVFKGSTSREDWLTNFRVALNEANTNTALDQVFPDIEIHSGFLRSFQSVTDNAASAAVNITAVLQRIAGGPVSPTRVVVSGHSLGAALATIAGPWAALTWPAADVRVVTFGAPLTGNEQFAEVVKLLAGRQGRVVHALDIVPALPPLDNYAHVDYSRWIPRNSTIVLEERPQVQFDTLNWDDHACRIYQKNVYTTNYTTAPADLAGVLANATTAGAGTPATTAASSDTPNAPTSADSPSLSPDVAASPDSASGTPTQTTTDGSTGAPTSGSPMRATASVAVAASCGLLAVACFSLL
mmetsp:Transcript_18367/g.55306  ORF Transcript_18367/g.55306 Transcript_18367/m.55306 type:complete len:738 (+) Transcript_18367:203-2416(+)